MNAAECPYCEKKNTFDYIESEEFEFECYECGKIFYITIEIIYDISTRTAPCLNGEPHIFEDNFEDNIEGYQSCKLCHKIIIKENKLNG